MPTSIFPVPCSVSVTVAYPDWMCSMMAGGRGGVGVVPLFTNEGGVKVM